MYDLYDQHDLIIFFFVFVVFCFVLFLFLFVCVCVCVENRFFLAIVNFSGGNGK